MAYTLVTACPVCGSHHKDLYYKGTQATESNRLSHQADYACTSSGYGRFPDIYQCRDCRLIYSGQRPSTEDLHQLYAQVEDEVYLKEEAGRVKTFEKALLDLNALCPDKGKLFEFGSYTGVYLELAKAQGWEVSGVELSDWARGIAQNKRGLSLFKSIDEIKHPRQNAFDAVVLWDVIEHVHDPSAMVAEASRLLKPGGMLGLSTMVLDSVSASLLKSKYPFLMEMHLIYFTRPTLIRLLETQGFDICQFNRHARYVSWGYLANKMPQLSFLKNSPAVSRALQNNFFCLSAGVRDVYARKRAR